MVLAVPMCVLSASVGVALARMSIDIFVQGGLKVLVGLASGAGAETRHTLGIAAFSGILWVTVLGPLPKALFYYVTERLALLRATPTKTNASSCAPQVPPRAAARHACWRRQVAIRMCVQRVPLTRPPGPLGPDDRTKNPDE